MLVAIAGGHGGVALRLTRLLAGRGDRVRSLIRDPAQAGDVERAGGEPLVLDLESATEDELAAATESADAVVFVAGAGPGSGPERKLTMDLGGAVKLVAAARSAGVRRYLMVSSMGADPAHRGDDSFSVYLRAKGRADAELASSGLDFTIVRPGRLTDEPGAGRVELSERARRGPISRDDVAAVLATVLHEPALAGRTLELVAGPTPIDVAVAAQAR